MCTRRLDELCAPMAIDELCEPSHLCQTGPLQGGRRADASDISRGGRGDCAPSDGFLATRLMFDSQVGL